MASKSEYQRALDKIDAASASKKGIYDALQGAQNDPAAALKTISASLDALGLARAALIDAFEEKAAARAIAPKRTRKAKKETA